MFANWSVTRRFAVLLSAALVAFLIGAVIEVAGVRARTNEIEQMRQHLNPAEAGNHEFLTAVVDQQVAVRNFVITGDAADDKGFEQDGKTARAALADMRALVTTPRSQAAVRAIDGAYARWLDEGTQPEIDAVRRGDAADARAHVATGIGDLRFNELRRAVVRLEETLEDEIAAANAHLDGLRRIITGTAIGAIVTGGALIFVIFVLLRRWVSVPLERVARGAHRVAEGRLDAPIDATGPPEINQLARDVEAMRSKLLGDLAGALRTNLLDVQQAERQRLAAELHDDPIQVLTVAVMRLDLLKAGVDDPAVAAKIDEARTAVRDAIDRLRTMLFELAPPSLDRHGIARALDDYTTELFAGTSTTVEVDSTLDLVLSSGVRSLAFRVAREAIANARKHASPSAVLITIGPAHGGVHLVVQDDGRGFTTGAERDERHRGLEFGSNLVRSAGGWWTITSTPGEGTTVEFWLPDAALVAAPPVEAPAPSAAT